MSLSTELTRSIERAQQGDRAALGRLLTLVRPLIERQLLRYPLSEEDRRDAAQSALMQLVRRVGQFRGDSSFTTWLFRVTANEALMIMRSQRRHRAHVAYEIEIDDVEGLASPQHEEKPLDGAAIEQEREAVVRDALDRLPDHYRDVVTAHYHRDLGLHEIAGEMQVTESAIRSRLHRARSKLRTLLTQSPVAREATASYAA